MTISHNTRHQRKEGGFINPEASILGAILLPIAAILLPVASLVQSRWLFVAGIVLVGIAAALFAIDIVQFRGHRRRPAKHTDGET